MDSRQLDEEAIFHVARRIEDAEARAEYLKQICAGDLKLRGRVEESLKVHELEEGFLKSSPDPGTTEDHAPITESPGQQIGPYKLLQKIGEGGFGVVYMAEQREPMRRRVALKIIKPGMDTKQVVARFEAERQALALMDHPNIAHVFDAGATETGRPFFIMELIKGVSVTEYCDKNELPTEQRLELFVDVCRAIQHAHQKGLIHRDLKPGNVMVTLHDGKPVPKVIDFGVSKALSQQLTEKTLFTSYGQMVGTPQYMSPEQAEMSGLDIDVRSDIYSLGVLLYELLTGTTPLEVERLRAAGIAEMQRMIREEDPPKPSVRLSTSGAKLTILAKNRNCEPHRLRRLIRGELDWIVMKSLEKERERRYHTANGFANDVLRYLHDETVSACPPSTWYRWKKTVRRHKVGFLAVGLVAASLLCGLVGTSWQWHQATRQKELTDIVNDELGKTNHELQQQVYRHGMNLAYHSWNEGNKDRLEQLLSSLIPESGEEDFRGIEWRLLWAMQKDHKSDLAIPTDSTVASISYSLDGSILAISSHGQRPFLYNLHTRESTFLPKDLRARQVKFSACGEYLIAQPNFNPSGRLDKPGPLQLLDFLEANQVVELKYDAGYVATAAVAPYGSIIAFAYPNGSIGIHKLPTGEKLGELAVDVPRDRMFALSNNGFLAAVDRRNRLVLWDVKTERSIAAVDNVRLSAWGRLALSPNGEILVLADLGGTLLWHVSDDGLELTKEIGGTINCVGFSADGNLLALGGADHRVIVWDLNRSRPIARLLHADIVLAVAFSPDGQQLAAGGRDNMVRLWDAGLWNEQFECRSVESFNPPLAVSPSGQVALCHEVEAGNALKLWDPDTGQETEIATSKSLFRSIAFSSDEQFLAAGDDDGRVWLWSLDSLDLVHEPRLAHGESVRSLAFSHDGRILASGGGSPGLLIWDVTTFEPHRVPGHIGAVYSVGFSDEGHLVAGGGIWRERGETFVWDLHGVLPTRTSHPLLRLDHPGRIVLCAAISRDGTMVAATHDYSAGDIRVYDVATGDCLQTFLGHASRTMCVLFSPDGTRLATAGDDRTVRLWDVESGEPLGTLDVGERVRKMAFLPDGNGFVTASWEGRARLWRAALTSDIPQR